MALSLHRSDGAAPLSATDGLELGRKDVAPKAATVSRVQCVVRLQPAGAIIEARGSNVTGVRPSAEAEWTWLRKGDQSSALAAGGQVALDKALPADALFTLCGPQSAGELRPVRWLWHSASGGWTAFAPELAARLEAAHSAGAASLVTDAERRVVFFPAMRQERLDDASRYRRVQREAAPPASPAASPALPATSPLAATGPPSVAAAEAAAGAAPAAAAAAAPSGDAGDAEAEPKRRRVLPRELGAYSQEEEKGDGAPPAATLPTTAPPAAAPSAAAPSAAAAGGKLGVARAVATPPDVRWYSAVPKEVIVRRPSEAPRGKVAAYDLDATLVRWLLPEGVFPTSLSQYALWSGGVLAELRAAHAAGCKLVIFSNQGGIKGAHEGKTAARVKGVIDWVAEELGVPLFACIATQKSEYRKPGAPMWGLMLRELNGGVQAHLAASSYTGDAAGRPGDIGDSDRDFAAAVGAAHGGSLAFRTPEEAFGAPEQVAGRGDGVAVPCPPREALGARAALLGGYWAEWPVLLVLCGPQGGGKSTFCEALLAGEGGGEGGGGAIRRWVVVCQDTVANGEPEPGERARRARRTDERARLLW